MPPLTDAQRRQGDRIWFIHKNLTELEPTVRSGHGPLLRALAGQLGCPPYLAAYLGRVLEASADELFAGADATLLNQRLEENVGLDAQLRDGCDLTTLVREDASRFDARPLAMSLPEPKRALVLPIQTFGGAPLDSGQILARLVIGELARVENLSVIGPQDIDAMLSAERMKDYQACEGVTCAADIGGALDCDYVVHGSLSKLGRSSVLQLNVVDARAVEVAARVQLTAPDTPEVLPALVVEATPALVGQLVARTGDR